MTKEDKRELMKSRKFNLKMGDAGKQNLIQKIKHLEKVKTDMEDKGWIESRQQVIEEILFHYETLKIMDGSTNI